MALDDALRSLADIDSAQIPGEVLLLRLGTIATVTSGAAADGNAAASVTVKGSTTPAPYLSSYTPTVGHTVAVLLVNNSPLILGRVIGLPAF